MIQQRKKRNSSKVNLTISFIFHGVLILVTFFFAAREGLVGKRLKSLAVIIAPKEKKPEPVKEKAPEPKVEQAKTEQAPKLTIPQPKVETAAAPPPAATDAAPAVAPPVAIVSGMDFSDGAKEVQTISDPTDIYKALIEHTLRSRWNRPEDIADDTYVAEVELSVDAKGNVTDSRWLKGSGDKRWDDSVKAVVAQTKAIVRPPPKGFPVRFPVRFDVETSRTEPVIQLSSQ